MAGRDRADSGVPHAAATRGEPPASPAPPASAAESLEARLRRAGLLASAWSNGPRDRYAPHAHDYDKVLVVSEGSITFGLVASGARRRLEMGERLDLPAGTEHDAVVGPAGVTCLEAHLPAGSLDPVPRSRGRDW